MPDEPMLPLFTPAVIKPMASAEPFRRQAADAFMAHQQLLSDPNGYTRQMGPQGYAQALAEAGAAWRNADLAYAKARGGQ